MTPSPVLTAIALVVGLTIVLAYAGSRWRRETGWRGRRRLAAVVVAAVILLGDPAVGAVQTATYECDPEHPPTLTLIEPKTETKTTYAFCPDPDPAWQVINSPASEAIGDVAYGAPYDGMWPDGPLGALAWIGVLAWSNAMAWPVALIGFALWAARPRRHKPRVAVPERTPAGLHA